MITPKQSTKNFWAREFKILNTLLKKFPDKQFWEEGNFDKVYSLTVYLSSKLEELETKYTKYFFQLETGKKQKKLGEKIDEDYNVVNKPKSVKNFLK